MKTQRPSAFDPDSVWGIKLAQKRGPLSVFLVPLRGWYWVDEQDWPNGPHDSEQSAINARDSWINRKTK